MRNMKKYFITILLLTLVILLNGCNNMFITINNDTYTYHTFQNEQNITWNCHLENKDKSFLINRYTEIGLYSYILTDDLNNYQLVPEMAESYPIDITKSYQGQYNVPSDATSSYVYKVNLNKQAKWQNNVNINADTYIESLKELANPNKNNPLLEQYNNETFQIANINKYSHQGKQEYISYQEYLSITNSLPHDLYISEYEIFKTGNKNFYSISDHKTKLEIASKYLYGTTPYEVYQTLKRTNDLEKHLYTLYTYPNISFNEVGLQKEDDYTLIFILDKPIDVNKFMITLTKNFIIYIDLYKQGNYATSINTYLSYGPYKLKYSSSSKVSLIKNETFYNYNDNNIYQTTNIEISYSIKDKVDINLIENTYDNDIYIEPTDVIDKLTINSNYQKLNERNNLILLNKTFRKAISYSINRSELVSNNSFYPLPCYGLLNDLYLTNLNPSIRYRNTNEGINVINEVYKPTDIKNLWFCAYNESITEGYYQDNQIINIEILCGKNSDQYNQTLKIIDMINRSTISTPFNNKIKINIIQDDNRYIKAYTGDFDIMWTTWGGKVEDPWSFIEVYANPNLHYEYGLNTNEIYFKSLINNNEEEHSIYEWYQILQNNNLDNNIRLEILAKIEENYLKTYAVIPISTRTKQYKYSDNMYYQTKTFVHHIGFDDIRYIKYYYTDNEYKKQKN